MSSSSLGAPSDSSSVMIESMTVFPLLNFNGDESTNLCDSSTSYSSSAKDSSCGLDVDADDAAIIGEALKPLDKGVIGVGGCVAVVLSEGDETKAAFALAEDLPGITIVKRRKEELLLRLFKEDFVAV
jgi:hypothetical protein